MHPPAPATGRFAARPPRRRRWLLAATLLLGLASACGDDAGGSAGGTGSSAAEGFPVTVTAANGEVEIDDRPERIVSLSASLTEMVFAIGAGDQVEAVDGFSDHPEGTPVTELSAFRPNVEAVAAYEPDLVVLSSGGEEVVAALEELDVPTLVLTAAESLDDVYEQITTLGDATGHPDEAETLVEDLRTEIRQLADMAPERDEPSTYYLEVSDSYHSVTSDTFIGEILGLAGLRSIADGVDDTAGGYPQLSAEAVVDADPDWIFVARSGEDIGPSDIAGRPGWESMSAVAGGRIVALDEDTSTRWGPRVVELLRQVVDATAAR